MAAAAASASMAGPMGSLLSKLSNLLVDEYSQLKGIRKDIEFLHRELGAMSATLQRLAADEEDLDAQGKERRLALQDLAYEVEDCIDSFTHHLERGGDSDGGIVRKALRKARKLKSRHQIATQIQQLKSRVVEESERWKRYQIEGVTGAAPKLGFVRVDPRLAALYVEANRLVGIDSPREELIELVKGEKGGDCEEGEGGVKVVSIVGFGGLGKTTLANQVYERIKGWYDCAAFVSVSQNPNLRNVLMSIVRGVGGRCRDSDDEQELIRGLREYLQDKRYFVVVDDLWSTEAWNIIKCAFLENSFSNGVMTTTRIESIAAACCHDYNGQVYRIKPLDDLDAKKLFFRRTFGSEDACPEQLKDNAKYILKKCGGVPLAIISIASLLASQEATCKEKWDYIQNSLRFELEENSSLGWMKHDLNLSYNDLSHDLRACLLYLGMFPEDSIIKKDDLVRQWVAEGFVNDKYGRDLEEVAESYFNDLVNRSMVQLTEFSKAKKCRVHDLMLDFIVSKCIDENFLTIIDGKQSKKGPFKARWVSLQFNNYREYMLKPENMGLLRVRSLAFHQYAESMPDLSTFKLLRVVDLMGNVYNDKLDLTSICSLHELRYLRIKRNSCKLPLQIQSLQHLKTLELRNCVGSIPSDILHLSSLQHLVFPKDICLPDEIGKMTAIRTLKVFNLEENSERNIQDLGSLTNLRELKLYHSSRYLEEEWKRKEVLLVSSLSKLSNL
uniref:NB-ARC domain-containing protein n=1 Tax=Leersia perrieri TaxID=77586 RepID=A0A0D9XTM2_9ORYZ